MNVFDFDETIYDGESSMDFILYFIRHDPSLIRVVPRVMITLIKYKKGKISLEEFKNGYAKDFEEYFSNCKLNIPEIVADFWDGRMHKIKPFYKQVQKADDVVLTASPSFIMEEICSRLGIKHLVATELNTKTGVISQACFREGKIDCFFNCFPDAEIDEFYTDSMNDKFMFPYAKKVFMVKKHKLTQIK